MKESWKKYIDFLQNIKQKNHATPNTEIMAVENSALHLRNKLHLIC